MSENTKLDILKFTEDKLSVETITDLVLSPKCGAISTFIGTTRDNFDNREVVKLEYEAYETMGLKAMKTICEEIRQKWIDVETIAIYHRLGTVPVKEASIVIAISSPHRVDAIRATEFCIDNVKKSVPIWKKEIYNKIQDSTESLPPLQTKFTQITAQEVQAHLIPQHLIQIKATNEEMDKRIERFIDLKRNEINEANVRDFCRRDPNLEIDASCARIDSVLTRRKDSKGHLQVNRVYNKCSYQDQYGCEYLRKHIPLNGIHERCANLECQLSLETAVPKNIYIRLKRLEDRLIYLETISPEYIQFWDKTAVLTKGQKRKKIFSIEEIDNLISTVESRQNGQKCAK